MNTRFKKMLKASGMIIPVIAVLLSGLMPVTSVSARELKEAHNECCPASPPEEDSYDPPVFDPEAGSVKCDYSGLEDNASIPFGWPEDTRSTTGPVPTPDVILFSIAPQLDYEVVIDDVPAYNWRHGCAPTSAGMVISYWDEHGYPDLIPGSSAYECIASEGNYNDYCLPKDSTSSIKPDKSELPYGDEHPDDCIADFMKTSQSRYYICYGWSHYSLLPQGMTGYVSLVNPDYSSYVYATNLFWGELTWDLFCKEIDANRPVVLSVDSNSDGKCDHAVTAIGYGEADGVRMYTCYNTWDTNHNDDWYEFEAMAYRQAWGIYGATFFGFDTSGSISGHVYQSDGTTPVEGAVVEACSVDGSFSSEQVVTSSTGSYTIDSVPAGEYRVFVNTAMFDGNYITEYYGGAYTPCSATPVTVAELTDTPDMDFNLDIGGSISGHVFRADGTTPVPEAQVQSYSADGTWQSYYAFLTEPDGSYTIPGVPSGSHIVRVIADGYITEYFGGSYHESQVVPVQVSVPNDTAHIDISLDTGGSVSGRVTLANGTTPVQGANVRAYFSDGTWQSTVTFETDADGYYTVTGLPEEDYIVWVNTFAFDDTFITEYYDGVYTPDMATPVYVNGISDTSGIDFSLDTGGSISGSVRHIDGVSLIAGAEIRVCGIDSTWANSGSYTTNSDGTYILPGIPDGVFTVRAVADGYVSTCYGGSYYEEQSTPVTVFRQTETSNIDFSLNPGGSISGHVLLETGASPIENASVEAAFSGMNIPCSTAITDEEGYYRIEGLPVGDYTVNTVLEGSDLIREWYSMSSDAYYPELAATVSITYPRNIPDTDFSLNTGGTVSGRVCDRDTGLPVSGATVYIYGESETPCSTVYTQSDGSYTTTGLAAGIYTINVLSKGYISGWYGGPEALPVTVTVPDAVMSIDVSLENAPETVIAINVSDEVLPGSDFVAAIETNTVTGFTTAQYYLQFDPSVLRLDAVTDGLIGQTSIPVSAEELLPGHWKIAQSAGSGSVNGSGYLAQLHFHALGGSGSNTHITIQKGILNSAEDTLYSTWKGSRVALLLSGDANGDTLINALDITEICRMILMITPENDEGDVNGDGAVNVCDIAMVVRMILGIP